MIAVNGDNLKHIAHGVIHLNEKWSLAQRLNVLNQEIQNLYKKYAAPVTVCAAFTETL